jgi:hypothetical protein
MTMEVCIVIQLSKSLFFGGKGHFQILGLFNSCLAPYVLERTGAVMRTWRHKDLLLTTKHLIKLGAITITLMSLFELTSPPAY